MAKFRNSISLILKLAIGDILQVSPDTDSLISNGYHNNLKMSQSCDFLPIHALFKTTIDIQISYFSGVRSSKYYFDNCPDHLHATTHSTCWIFLNPKTKIGTKMWSPLTISDKADFPPLPCHFSSHDTSYRFHTFLYDHALIPWL